MSCFITFYVVFYNTDLSTKKHLFHPLKKIRIHVNELERKSFPSHFYGIRLSHIFEIPSISNEKPSISIEIPSISIKNLGFRLKY